MDDQPSIVRTLALPQKTRTGEKGGKNLRGCDTSADRIQNLRKESRFWDWYLYKVKNTMTVILPEFGHCLKCVAFHSQKVQPEF